MSTSSVVRVSDAIGLADLIEKTVKDHTEAVESAIARDERDLEDYQSKIVEIAFGPDILLQLSAGNYHYDSVRIEAKKITGFWSDRVVSGSLNVDRFSEKPELKASMSASAGGEDLKGITEAQAYVNKGRAIKLVAEAMVILEISPTMKASLMAFDKAMNNLKGVITKRQQEAANAKLAAFQEALTQDSDLIRIDDVEAVVNAMKDIALNNEYGEKALLVFHDGRPTERQGKEALKAVAFFNNSSNKRQMTSQYMDSYAVLSKLTREPGSSSRRTEKLSLKDLKFILANPAPVFISRSMSDPKLIERL